MSLHCGYVVKIDNLRKHNNADRLQITTIFGNEIIVDMQVKEGDIGIYFPTDLQLSPDFCFINHLCRKGVNGEPDTGYLDPDKRNIKALKLRGEHSEGLYVPLETLAPFGDISSLSVGDNIDLFNGHEICKKYVPYHKTYGTQYSKKGTPKKKINVAPLFAEHVDTEQLAYNLDKFKAGDVVELTLKMHGTSQRTGYLPVFKKFKRSFLDVLFGREGKAIYEYDYIDGTRRTVLSDGKEGFYGTDEFRKSCSSHFAGKLLKGETVYYEVVGYVKEDTPIMPSANNSKVNDSSFKKMYGNTTVFSYGCENGECDFYVYRMTYTTPEGDVIEYSPSQVRARCEQMNIKTVPLFETVIIPNEVDAGEYIKSKVEQYYDGPDPIGKTHIREGVVARIINRPDFKAYKHKNFYFKVVSGIAQDNADYSNMSQDAIEET